MRMMRHSPNSSNECSETCTKPEDCFVILFTNFFRFRVFEFLHQSAIGADDVMMVLVSRLEIDGIFPQVHFPQDAFLLESGERPVDGGGIDLVPF